MRQHMLQAAALPSASQPGPFLGNQKEMEAWVQLKKGGQGTEYMAGYVQVGLPITKHCSPRDRCMLDNIVAAPETSLYALHDLLASICHQHDLPKHRRCLDLSQGCQPTRICFPESFSRISGL